MTDLFWDAVSASLRNKRSLFKKNYKKKKNGYVTRALANIYWTQNASINSPILKALAQE